MDNGDRPISLGAFVGTERFSILRELGAGGMGTVYAALDRERGVTVALKTLREISPDGLFRFKREFREFRDLHHPNLVSLHELHCDAGVWFFTMDLVEGVDFLTWVRPRGILDIVRLRNALKQLTRAVLALHDAGKIHRDIKPSNILVTRDGRLVLLDFGIAGDVLRRSTDAVMGTLAYMAPEQALGHPLGPATDWYAIGVTLYEALAGQLPVSGSAYAMLIDKFKPATPHPRSIAPESPEDLDQLCSELLVIRPEARPLGRQLIERLEGRLAPPRAEPHFIGRARELELLESQYEGSKKSLHTVAVIGESGIGKTELVQHFLRLVGDRDRECVILSGRCHQREQLPFQAVDGWMDSLSSALRHLADAEVASLLPERIELLAHSFPVLRRVCAIAHAPPVALPPELRERRKLVFTVFRDLVAAVAERVPVVLFIDDLHWIDEDSSALVTTLLQEPGAPAALLLGTLRSGMDQQPAIVRRLQGFHLERLAATDALVLTELLSYASPCASGMIDALRIAEQSAGHPLFIDVLVRHAATRGGAAATLEEALAWEIAELAPGPRAVVSIASVAAGPLSHEVAVRALDLSPEGLVAAVSQLSRAHLLRSSGGGKGTRIEPYHARIRGAVLAALTPEETRSLHMRLARSLEKEAAPDPSVLFGHFLAARELERASHFARLAGDEASRALAFDRAATLYQECLALLARPEPEILVSLAEAFANDGRAANAADAYLQAAEFAAPEQSTDLRRRAAQHLLRAGHVERGLETLGGVLKAVNVRLPDTPEAALRALALSRLRLWLRGTNFVERPAQNLPRQVREQLESCWAAATGLAVIDPLKAAHFHTLHLWLALEAGDLSHIAKGLAMNAAFLAVSGKNPAKSARMLAHSRQLVEPLDSAELRGLLALTEAVIAVCDGRWKEAQGLCRAAESFLRNHCQGVSWEIDNARFFGLAAAYWTGDLRGLQDEVAAQLSNSEARGDLFAQANVRTVASPLLALVDDDPLRARSEIERAVAAWPLDDFHVQHLNAALTLAQVELYDGRAGAAHERLQAIWRSFERSQLSRIQYFRVWARYVRACAAIALGDVQHALSDARHLEREGGWAHAMGQILRAACDRSEGRLGAWREAARLLEEAALDLFAACARVRAGDAAGAEWLEAAGVRNTAALANALTPIPDVGARPRHPGSRANGSSAGTV
jgi:hypothetical protein